MEQKRKTHAERIAEREEAVLKHQQKLAELRLAGAFGGKTSADLPSEIERPHPKTNKSFMAVGFGILALLILGLIFTLISSHRGAKDHRPAATEQKAD